MSSKVKLSEERTEEFAYFESNEFFALLTPGLDHREACITRVTCHVTVTDPE